MQCTYFIFLLHENKNKGSLHLILNRHGECTVILSVLFACCNYWLLIWCSVVSFSVVYIAYVKPFFILVWCLISVLVWVMYFVSFLEKVNTELIHFFVGNLWSTYISTLNYLFQQMSPGTLYPGRIHFWIWIIAEASIPSF